MDYFKIGNVRINGKGVLAPMLDFTTLPFRILSRNNSCSLAYTEMVHINQLATNDIENIDSLKSTELDSPLSVQIVGDFTDIKKTLTAVYKLDKYKFCDIIDLNLGCPSKKIVSNNSGSALLKNIKKVVPIIRKIKETCKKPITVKTRLGYEKNEILDISKELFSTNIDALAIHSRTALQKTNDFNVDSIKLVSKDSPIPIIYNGGINYKNVDYFLDIGFDAIMIGRAALGNPLIFRKIDSIVKGKNIENISFVEKIKLFKDFLILCRKYPISFRKIKISSLQFFNDFFNAKKLRVLINESKSLDELEKKVVNQIDQ